MGQVMDMYPANRQSHSLARDDRGNLTVLTAFILASMVALVGLAVDLEFIFRQQARVQYAMDSAVPPFAVMLFTWAVSAALSSVNGTGPVARHVA